MKTKLPRWNLNPSQLLLLATSTLLPAIALVGCSSERPPPTVDSEPPTLVIHAARVFDGETMLDGSTVVLRDDRILAIQDEPPESDGVEVLQCENCTLLPGLIDAHTHIRFERQLQQALVFGVTTELDLYTFLPIELRTQLREDLGRGSRVDMADFRMATTPVTSPGGLGVRFDPEIPTLADEAGAQAFVDARLAEGADYIKIMYDDGHAFGGDLPNLSDGTLLAAVQAAHARGKLAVTHVSSGYGARAAVDAGADGFAHVFLDELPDEALSRDAAERGMFLIATLTTWQGDFEGPSGAGLAADERFVPYLHPSAIENLTAESALAEWVLGSFETVLGTVRQFHEAGVTVLAGTDVANPGTAHGVSMHRELELLVRAGLTPTEALAAATSQPADQFGLDDRGRIAPGLRADLLLVRGDPTVDILATREIVAVIRGGALVNRESLAAEIASSRE
jgi:imidazolonepropionase-like amidohydrolase